MSALKTLAILLIFPPLFAVSLAPAIYQGLGLVINPVPWPFSRVFDRACLLGAVLAVWNQRKYMELQFVRQSLRLPTGIALKAIILTVLFTAVMSLSLLPVVVSYGQLNWAHRSLAEVTFKLVKTLPVALLIGGAEEIFFRGLVFRKLTALCSTWWASVLVSMLYAMLHFFSAQRGYNFISDDYLQGFDYFSLLLKKAFPLSCLPAVLGMFLIGLSLTLPFIKTGKLHYSIGMHAGWILVHKLSLYMTVPTPAAAFVEGVGRRYYLLSLPITWCLVGVICLLVIQSIPLKSSNHA